MQTIVIEVRGGVVQDITQNIGEQVRVIILDYDTEGAAGDQTFTQDWIGDDVCVGEWYPVVRHEKVLDATDTLDSVKIKEL